MHADDERIRHGVSARHGADTEGDMQIDDDRSSGVEWSHPMEGWFHRIKWGFVFVSWLIAFALAALVTALLGTLGIWSQDNVASTTDTEIVVIAGVVVTFLAFFGVMFWRLQQLDHDRFLNSITVGAVHTLVSFAVLGTVLIVRAATGGDFEMRDFGFDTGGLIFSVLERTAAASIPACLLAPAVMPARGPLPKGTQRERVPTDRQL